MELLKYGAYELAQKIKSKELTPIEVIRAYIHKAETVNPKINAITEDNFKAAEKIAQSQTQSLDETSDTSTLPDFFGVPFSIKEMIAVEGKRRTAGNIHRISEVCSYNATVVERLNKAGAIPLCTTNVPELGFWFETHNNVYGRTNNPFDYSRTCGGSSGGEAALIGAGASPMGLGSDIGGSARMPAFFCGIVGHKPTNLTIPLTGHFPLSPEELANVPADKYTYTTMGLLAKKVQDVVQMMKHLIGPDGIDPMTKSVTRSDFNFSNNSEIDFNLLLGITPDSNADSSVLSSQYSQSINESTSNISSPSSDKFSLTVPNKSLELLKEKFKSITVYYIESPEIHGCSATDSELAYTTRKAVDFFKSLGCIVKPLNSDFFKSAMRLWFAGLRSRQDKKFIQILTNEDPHFGNWELAKELIKFPLGASQYTFPSIVMSFLEKLGVADKDLASDMLTLENLISEYNQILGKKSILITPPHPRVAPKHNAPFTRPFDFIYTGIFNVMEVPVTCVPMGLSSNGLPLGVQISATADQDNLTLAAAYLIEQEFGGWVENFSTSNFINSRNASK